MEIHSSDAYPPSVLSRDVRAREGREGSSGTLKFLWRPRIELHFPVKLSCRNESFYKLILRCYEIFITPAIFGQNLSDILPSIHPFRGKRTHNGNFTVRPIFSAKFSPTEFSREYIIYIYKK